MKKTNMETNKNNGCVREKEKNKTKTKKNKTKEKKEQKKNRLRLANPLFSSKYN